jgi:hypothetical protein
LIKETPLRNLKLFEYPSFKSHGILCSIIDYSLSSFNFEGQFHFRDLNDDAWIFDGNAEIDNQFQVYKEMKQSVGNNWSQQSFQTNISWIRHLIGKIHHRASSPNLKEELSALLKRISGYDSCSFLVKSDPYFTLKNNF